MTRFYAGPMSAPKDVIPFLGKGELHWRKGYSAYELTHRWFAAKDGVPDPVRSILDQSEEWRGASVLEGFFERKTELRSAGRASQTDLLAVLRLSDGLGILGIEGKVEEPFGLRVHEWLADGSQGKQRRLDVLCAALGIAKEQVGELRYQLLHRTAATLFEAESYAATSVAMLVHSFSAARTGYDDFARFAEVLGTPVSGPDRLSGSLRIAGTRLWIGWASDKPTP